MEGPEVLWIENEFTEKYLRDIKRTHIIPYLLFSAVLVINVVIGLAEHKEKYILVNSLVPLAIAVIAYFALRSGDGNLPTKIGVSRDGLFFVKRNGKEGFVPWEKVYKIRVMDSRHPKDYMFYYTKSDSGFVKWLYKYFIDFPELVLGFEAAQAVIKAYDEYRERAWR